MGTQFRRGSPRARCLLEPGGVEVEMCDARPVRIRQATIGDIRDLSALIWLDTRSAEPDPVELESFVTELGDWWADRGDGHHAFVAEYAGERIVGMAWIALQPRVPRPGEGQRSAADIQTLFVLAEHRGQGIGSALVDAAAHFAMDTGAARVTVHSGHRALPVYERLGFRSHPRLLQRRAE